MAQSAPLVIRTWSTDSVIVVDWRGLRVDREGMRSSPLNASLRFWLFCAITGISRRIHVRVHRVQGIERLLTRGHPGHLDGARWHRFFGDSLPLGSSAIATASEEHRRSRRLLGRQPLGFRRIDALPQPRLHRLLCLHHGRRPKVSPAAAGSAPVAPASTQAASRHSPWATGPARLPEPRGPRCTGRPPGWPPATGRSESSRSILGR